MKANQPINKLFIRLWQHVRFRRRIQFSLLLLLMVVASFAEILSIGAILPFLAVLTSPDQAFYHPMVQPLITQLGVTAPEQLLFPLTVLFSLAAILAGAMRMLLLWASTRVSFATGADLSISIYRRTLYQPYSIHVSRNSSEIINGISTKANSVIYSTIVPCITIISSVIMMVVILGALLSVNPFIALVAFSSFGLVYAIVIWLTRKRLLRNSHRIANESTQVIKSLQEGLGGIRDVLIDGNQSTYCQIYRKADLPLRQAQGNTLFISQCPRFAVESLGMLIIAILAYRLAQDPAGIIGAVPVLGALALGAQRLLPVLQQAYGAWSGIQGGKVSLQDTLELLEQPLPSYVDQKSIEAMSFRKSMELRAISFRYTPESPWVLTDLSLTIPRGARVGFIGKTGSGKSTLLDIIMGLLEPTKGAIFIDDVQINNEDRRPWQRHIAHVPQSIFLTDATIKENIAFGIPEGQIDLGRVKEAAERAQISTAIEALSNGYETAVGERGVRLSGGQRQRIGIARALYKRADVMIFDEATSALDNETEQELMQAIEGLNGNITVLIIAHRLTTLKNCTQIVELNDGGIQREGSYNEIINQVA